MSIGTATDTGGPTALAETQFGGNVPVGSATGAQITLFEPEDTASAPTTPHRVFVELNTILRAVYLHSWPNPEHFFPNHQRFANDW